ncbi:MAG: monomeric [FeFe] hydrogenase [Lentimicrobium sp.]|jgi:[FeFe] hydrogenase (group B1/B3)|nr:monomeric [FeFe] hydrogenase [Lentimicrobium sp.]
MAQTNNATLIRREIITRLCKLYVENRLEDVDRIALEMAPRNGTQAGGNRCCIHKSRAIIKYRVMALLGFNVSDETDELESLYSYALRALSNKEPEKGVLTVVDEACTSCVKSNYVVSNLCRGCLASHCMVTCPKNAITMEHGQAKIDPLKCVGCGLCKEACPYHAIIYVPIPCEESCPVKAIYRNAEGVEEIDYDKCIHCGRCMVACPFGAVMYRSQIINVLHDISRPNRQVIAMLAPAICGQFKASYGQVATAVKKLGFTDVFEVADGAVLTAKEEARELEEVLGQGQQFLTTSCCPAFVELTEKQLPALKPFVSHTPSPMRYSAELVKQQYPDASVVFIGPCVAKQAEARKYPGIDYVMTFEELGAMMIAMNVDLQTFEAVAEEEVLPERRFAVSNGVLDSVAAYYKGPTLNPLVISGLHKKNIASLRRIATGKHDWNMIEVMACEGGCLSGPAGISSPEVARKLFNAQSGVAEGQPAS